MLRLDPARPDDPDALPLVEAVQAYYVEIYGGADEDPLDPLRFTPPDGKFLLGRLGGPPVAMGGSTFASGQPATAQLRRMFVAPGHRRHGYARLVLEALEADARAAGAERTILTTGEPQEAAVALYRAAGYVDTEPFGHYAGSPAAVHLGKRL